MWSKIRDAVSETLDHARAVAGGTRERASSVAESVVEKAKDLAGDTGQAAKTAGHATAEGVSTALNAAGRGLSGAGAVVAQRAIQAGEGAKRAARSAAKAGHEVAGTTAEIGAITWKKVDERIETYWPAVRDTVVVTAGGTIRAAAANDATMERVFKVAYVVLPADIRRWVSEEQFVKFCFRNRDRLVGPALLAAAPPEAPALPAPDGTLDADAAPPRSDTPSSGD